MDPEGGDLGRERFIERVWDWVHQYGGVILSQLKTLGCSFDWDRTRFTMDEKYVEAVLEEFVRWWDEGHIYRGKRVINWCPRCLTAISDIEVEHTNRAGKLYHIKYPFKDGSGHVFVATTRPETMLGDTAAVANPTDERYKDLFGRTILLPLVGREIPFLADEYASPEFGTGVVKVTPAHDPNDFEVGLRHNLEKIVVIDEQGKMSADAGARYAGLDRFEARKLVVEDLEAQGFLQKADDYTIPTGTCERCHTVIEPLLSEQWFVRMSELAKPAIEAVRDGRISFVPERYKRVYLDWMENIKDWCISRQLWFGHRIPVWKTDDGEYIVARSEQEAVSKAGGRVIVQDEDVLDTWFSSALWPHAVLGWPDKTPDLDRYYPTSVLVTAREIIYLWVARMIMTGFDFMGEIPYSSVYVYATVLNEEGRRMSKSLGTGVDPLDLIAIYGTDALRFSLLVRTAKGQDIRFAGMKEGKQKQVEEARNFANKIWNAARFVLMNVEKSSGIEAKWVPSDALADRWILSELDLTIRQVNEALEDYRINDVGQTLYHFFWDDFCDWYIELSKALVASSEDTQEARNARGRILYVLESSLRLLHPLMPFITEDIWQRLPHSGESIMIAPFPQAREGADDEEARAEMATLINVITRIRNIRSEFNVPNSSRIAVHLSSDDAGARALIQSNLDYIERLARVHVVSSGESIPQLDNAARDIVSGIEIAVPLEGLIDVTKERERLSREVNRKENEASGLATRLQNESFVDKAPAEVVEQARLRHSELLVDIEKLRSTLRSLG